MTLQQNPDAEASSTPQVDVYLYTDGSGHQDGYGGSGSLAIGPALNIYATRMAGFKGTSVERAEFEALLMGCQSILEAGGFDDHNGRERLRRTPLRVQWFSDRESLVQSVTRGPDGAPVYRRKASPDLWARFAFYEQLFEFLPVFVPRETSQFHSICDRFASDARALIKDYMELPDNETFRLLIEAAKKISPCNPESSPSPDPKAAENQPQPVT
jgi:hypothetical protein